METAIGRCDRCGVVDHHLIEGLCPQCDELVVKHADSSLDKEEVPLGAEADVSHVEKLSYMMPSLRRHIGG